MKFYFNISYWWFTNVYLPLWSRFGFKKSKAEIRNSLENRRKNGGCSSWRNYLLDNPECATYDWEKRFVEDNRRPMHSVLKHVLKKYPNLSREEVVKKALEIESRYEDANQEQNEKIEIEAQKQWDKSLQEENDQLALEMLTGSKLSKYFNTKPDDSEE